MTERPYMTPEDVTTRLSLSRKGRVYRWIKTGWLPACDVSTEGARRPCWRISPDDFDALVARLRTRAAETTAGNREAVLCG